MIYQYLLKRSAQLDSKFGHADGSFSIKELAAASVLGGTASVITGGKFGNGAITAAFENAFNQQNAAQQSRRHITGQATFVNDNPNGASPDQPVQNSLADAIEGANRITGDTVNINSTTGGGRSVNDPHAQGRAVDINSINGISVRDPQAIPLLERYQAALQTFPQVNQILSPNLNVNINGGSSTTVTNQALIQEHTDHMHVNVSR